ncbi:MobF family relaxase [Sphingomonas xinjiangensis]|uniref:Conjugative relaxase-like TrwC/TraI family protein n=1 Tax=Sphingomonas xinjiangensis TaxID=643568 RepID=A0A840YSS4_9SPHN|nr:MobF family relaxase [Sphingomonas xinjiangensis]MBB5712751.1 conjugative relaxase-like TrwC/TraI family protein [Sphingomonas xinjiangensis]
MHSISSIKSAGGAADYYGKDDFAAAEYYAGENAADYSEWGGGAAEAAGVSGEVTKSDLGKVLNGQIASGEKVAQYEGRRPGYDLTFSAPKSVSIMALVAGDKRILGPEGAHTKAVRQTMAWIEKNLAETRQDVDGKKVPVKTGNLLYALVQHDTSRALDPQAHIHALVANLTKHNDKWMALHADKIWSNNTVIGSIYHGFLRAELEKLGYQIETRGKHGTFEIVGVPKDVMEVNSQRRAEILKAAAALGIASPKGRDGVTITTRDPKLNIEDRDKLIADWREKASALGFDGESLRDKAMAAAMSREGAGPIERGYAFMAEVVKGAREFVGNLTRTPDPLVDKGVARLAASPEAARAQFAVASAVRIHSQREAAFDVYRLAKTALDLGLKGVTIDHVSQRIDRLVDQGRLLPGVTREGETGYTVVTTREALQTEEKILERVEANKGQATPLIAAAEAPERVQAAAKHELNPGQLAAATLIVSSQDKVVAIQGVAGAGKSTMLQAVAQTFEAAARVAESGGKTLHGLAFQTKMVADLKEGAGIEAQTIASFIWHNQRFLTDRSSPEAVAKRAEMKNTILAVDEASMVSSNDMLKLIQISEALGVDKLALVGDRKQLASIDAGKAFSMMQAGGVTVAYMNENLRQKTDTLRTVAALANVGKASDALRVLGDKVVQNENPALHAADLWLGLSKEERAATAVFASGRDARATINNRIQEGLAAEGTLKGEGLALTVREPVNLTREELRYAKNYSAGQILEVTGRIPELRLYRGTFNVSRVLPNGKVELERDGRKLKIDPQKIDPKITENRLELSTPKGIRIHEGDALRWTDKDKDRELHRSGMARVLAIDSKGVTVETGAKETLTLPHGDPMLSRIDLAYSLNMHMAQGVTAEKAITAMSSAETNLTNQQLFNVAVTRVRSELTVVVNDTQKVSQQLDRNTGIKTSAVETVGRLNIDGPGSSLGGTSPASTPTVSVRIGQVRMSGADDLASLPRIPEFTEKDAARYAKPDEMGVAKKHDDMGVNISAAKEGRQLPVPEKNLGLEL